MEFFSIRCDSCTSRLKVRSLSAIGQILTCPKCGSMVQVQPPEGWEPPPDEQSDAPATAGEKRKPSAAGPTKRGAGAGGSVDFEEVETLLTGRSGAAPSPGAAVASPPRQRDPVAAVDASSTTSQKFKPAVAPGQGPLLPTAEWTSAESRQRRRLTLIVTSGIGMLAIAAMLIVYLVSRMGTNDSPEIGDGPVGPTADASGAADDLENGSDERRQAPPTIDGSEDTDDSIGVAINPGGDATSNDDNDLAQPSDADATESNDTSDPDELPETGSGGNGAEAPPGFHLNEDQVATNAPPDDPILYGLEELDSFIENTGFDSAREAAELQFRRDSWDLFDPEIPYVEPPSRRQYDVSALLDAALIELQFPGTTLDQALTLFGELSGLPISIDHHCLQMPDFDPHAAVSIESQDTTVGGALRALLEPLHLDFRPQQFSIVIVPRTDMAPSTERRYAVDDLIQGFTGGADELISVVTALVAPPTWSTQGGSGTIRIDSGELVVFQTEPTHRQVALLLDNFRVARSAAPENGDHSLLRTRADAAADCLAEPLQFASYQPRRIGEVIDDLSAQANITLLVDWESLIIEGWTPDTELPLVVQEGTVEDALRKLAATMGIAFRIHGPREFELTSRDDYLRERMVEFYNCAAILDQGVSVDELAQRILSVFPGDLTDATRNRFYFDGESRHLVGRLNPREQKALGKFLIAWARTARRD